MLQQRVFASSKEALILMVNYDILTFESEVYLQDDVTL